MHHETSRTIQTAFSRLEYGNESKGGNDDMLEGNERCHLSSGRNQKYFAHDTGSFWAVLDTETFVHHSWSFILTSQQELARTHCCRVAEVIPSVRNSPRHIKIVIHAAVAYTSRLNLQSPRI